MINAAEFSEDGRASPVMASTSSSSSTTQQQQQKEEEEEEEEEKTLKKKTKKIKTVYFTVGQRREVAVFEDAAPTDEIKSKSLSSLSTSSRVRFSLRKNKT